jgi:hypothetical protein
MITTETWTQEQYDAFQEESRRASRRHPDHSSGQLSIDGQMIPVGSGGIAVESTGRGVRVIPPGTDLGRYFERQRYLAEGEAFTWMALFVGGSAATIAFGAAGGFAATWDYLTFYGAGRIAGYYVPRYAATRMAQRGIGPATVGRILRGGTRYFDILKGSLVRVQGPAGGRTAVVTRSDVYRRIITVFKETPGKGQFLKPGRWIPFDFHM